MRSLEMRKARERIVLYEVFFFGLLRMSVCVLVCVCLCWMDGSACGRGCVSLKMPQWLNHDFLASTSTKLMMKNFHKKWMSIKLNSW